MTLNTAAKDWLANNAGNANHCYVTSGLTYRDPDNIQRTGGTTDVISSYYLAGQLGSTIAIIANTTYTQFEAINGGVAIGLSDVSWVYANDGHTGTTAYCVAITTGDVSFTSSPSGASIYIDNDLQSGVTPRTITGLSVGSHTYRLTLTGYRDSSGSFSITAGQTTTVPTVTLIQNMNVSLNVSPTTINAGQSTTYTATVTGGSASKTYTWNNLPSGCSGSSSSVNCTPSSVGTYSGTTVTVNDGVQQITSNSVTLTVNMVVTTGDVSFTSSPSGASIYIDIVLQSGVTPRTITGLSVGSHTYRLTLTGYNDATGSFSITAGQTTTVPTVTLTPIVTTGSISCSTSPSGAQLWLDGNNTGQVTSYTLTNVSTGTHTVMFRLTGYNDCTVSGINVTSGGTSNASCTLTSVVTTGSISGNVKASNVNLSGVTVSDGTRSATTDTSGNYTISSVPSGTYTVTAYKTGYVTGSVPNVIVTAGNVTTGVNFSLSPVTATVGSINCSSIPTGTEIWLDGSNTGQMTPYVLTSVPTGQHNVTFKLNNYVNCVRQVTVYANQEASASCTLTSAGSINCSSAPIGAEIWLDSSNTGFVTPYTLDNIVPGMHTITFKYTGYNDCIKDVNVYAGQTSDVSCSMTIPGGAAGGGSNTAIIVVGVLAAGALLLAMRKQKTK